MIESNINEFYNKGHLTLRAVQTGLQVNVLVQITPRYSFRYKTNLFDYKIFNFLQKANSWQSMLSTLFMHSQRIYFDASTHQLAYRSKQQNTTFTLQMNLIGQASYHFTELDGLEISNLEAKMEILVINESIGRINDDQSFSEGKQIIKEYFEQLNQSSCEQEGENLSCCSQSKKYLTKGQAICQQRGLRKCILSQERELRYCQLYIEVRFGLLNFNINFFGNARKYVGYKILEASKNDLNKQFEQCIEGAPVIIKKTSEVIFNVEKQQLIIASSNIRKRKRPQTISIKVKPFAIPEQVFDSPTCINIRTYGHERLNICKGN